jgi:hypothetical protein
VRFSGKRFLPVMIVEKNACAFIVPSSNRTTRVRVHGVGVMQRRAKDFF